MTRLLVAGGFLLCLTATVRAQSVATAADEGTDPTDLTIGQFNPEEAVSPVSIVEGAGVKVGEGTVLRPVFGAETGVISNVFYSNTNPQAAGVFRLLAQIGTSSLGAARLNTTAAPADGTVDTGSLQYRASLRASYDFLLSSDQQITQSGGLGLGASLHGLANPMGTYSFGFDEDYSRLIRAADFEINSNLNRDINTARLLLLYHPQGSTIGGYLAYRNTIDVFEQNMQAYTDRMGNYVDLHPIWQLFPQTQLYLNLSWGVVTAIGNGPKSTSYPLVTDIGLATLLTPKVTFSAMAGYTNGFYARGPNFSAPVAGVNLGYRYSPLGRMTIGYQLAYTDSINANFYQDHVLFASLQQVLSPFVLVLQPEVHFRQYNGISVVAPQLMGLDTRNDVLVSVIAGLAYNFRDWFAATLNYRFTTQQTDYRYMVAGSSLVDPSYVRHELLLGLRIAM